MNHRAAAATRDEVLADTQETLRAVARALDSMAPVAGGVSGPGVANPMQRLARFLGESYGELAEILEGLRETRGLFRRAEMDRLQTTHATLQEVTSQTELATTGMLDGIERCLLLVERLAPSASPADAAPGEAGMVPDPREALQDELHQVMQHLQFQDITAQRIGHATGVLADVENRLVSLMGTLERYGFSAPEGEDSNGVDAAPALTESLTVCDPDATTQGAESRQALADDIFS